MLFFYNLQGDGYICDIAFKPPLLSEALVEVAPCLPSRLLLVHTLGDREDTSGASILVTFR